MKDVVRLPQIVSPVAVGSSGPRQFVRSVFGAGIGQDGCDGAQCQNRFNRVNGIEADSHVRPGRRQAGCEGC